jgi:predicted ferric reductase
VALLALAPVSVLQNTGINLILSKHVVLINVLQRIIGLWAFTLLFCQIILGFFMTRLVEKLGGWIYNFHVFEGITAYTLIILHPVFFMALNYFFGKGLDPFYIFTDFCVLCSTRLEFYYSLGRISFWLLTAGVFAGLFRTISPFLRFNWKKFHVLNYVAFFLIWLHSFWIGTDIGTFPFSIIHGPALVIVSVIAGFRLFKAVKAFK